MEVLLNQNGFTYEKISESDNLVVFILSKIINPFINFKIFMRINLKVDQIIFYYGKYDIIRAVENNFIEKLNSISNYHARLYDYLMSDKGISSVIMYSVRENHIIYPIVKIKPVRGTSDIEHYIRVEDGYVVFYSYKDMILIIPDGNLGINVSIHSMNFHIFMYKLSNMVLAQRDLFTVLKQIN